MPFTLAAMSFDLPEGHTAVLRVNFTCRGEKTLRVWIDTCSPTGHSQTHSQRSFELDDHWTSIIIERALPVGYEKGECTVKVTGAVDEGGDFELHPYVLQERVLSVEFVDENCIVDAEGG